MEGCGKTVGQVSIQDRFWSGFRDTIRKEGLMYQWDALNDRIPGAAPSYCMKNFRVAAGKEAGSHGGCVFQDSDVAKWLEGVAFSLRWYPDKELEAIADGAIEDIVAAQQSDGYMDTYYIINGLDKRWTNLKDHHELYCAGHMIEAAVAYFEVTGKRVLLDAVIRYVEYIDSVIGAEEGKMHGYPGHPVIEMALMRLYAVTQNPMHLKLAEYFVNQRGQKPLYFQMEDEKNGNGFYWKDSPFLYQYYQAGQPVREQMEAEGHSVRAMYLYSGMADVARETGDESLKQACLRLWNSTVSRRMYITGAIGSSEYGEAFTFDYDLPNDTIYGETCASIGLVFFARRMLTLEAKGCYADVMERALYNGVISGMELDGKKFFYVNPLEVDPLACEKDHYKRHVKPERQKWFGCACCPPNLIRLLMSLEDYVASAKENTLFMHLYINGTLDAKIGDTKVSVKTETEYPWNDTVRMIVTPEKTDSFCLALRIPGWSRSSKVTVNGETLDAKDAVSRDGYLYIKREWHEGDTVELMLDLTPRFVRANPKVREDVGCVALCRGPIVYCMEEQDNGKQLYNLRKGQATDKDVQVEWLPDTLGGIMQMHFMGVRESDEGWGDTLYAACDAPVTCPQKITMIPYYAWANRGIGEMRVWIRE